MNRNIVELFAAVLVCVFFAFALVEAWSYKGQSSYMPVAVTGFAVVMAGIWITQSVWKLATLASPAVFDPSSGDMLRFGAILIVMTIYVLGVTYLGFFSTTIVMVPVLAFLAGYRNLPATALGTILFVVGLYAVFRLLLSIPLPQDRLLNLVGLG